MKEILLLLAVTAIIIVGQLFVQNLRKPILSFARIVAAIGILLLAWLYADEGSVSSRVILSLIAFIIVSREFFSLLKSQSNR